MSDTLILLPDAELLIARFLNDQEEIAVFFDEGVDVANRPVTDSPTDRVYSLLPKDKPGDPQHSKVFPLVRVTAFGGQPRTRTPRYLGAPNLQLDAFAHRRTVANELIEICAALLASHRFVGVHDEGVVSGADVGHPFVADSGFPEVQMRAVTATVYLRPGGTVGS